MHLTGNVLAATYRRMTARYGERGRQFVHMEAGHVAQNVYLQATALGLGTVVVGAFDDVGVKAAMEIGEDEEPICLMPLGAPTRLTDPGDPHTSAWASAQTSLRSLGS